jgi:hypothetical protein
MHYNKLLLTFQSIAVVADLLFKASNILSRAFRFITSELSNILRLSRLVIMNHLAMVIIKVGHLNHPPAELSFIFGLNVLLVPCVGVFVLSPKLINEAIFDFTLITNNFMSRSIRLSPFHTVLVMTFNLAILIQIVYEIVILLFLSLMIVIVSLLNFVSPFCDKLSLSRWPSVKVLAEWLIDNLLLKYWFKIDHEIPVLKVWIFLNQFESL